MRKLVKSALIILMGAALLLWAANYHRRKKVKPLPDSGGYTQSTFDRYENGDKRLGEKK